MILYTTWQELKRAYDALLTMYGEKVEETDELRMDLADLKQMYRQLLQEHVDGKSAVSLSARTDREQSAQQQSKSVLEATRPSQQLQTAAELSEGAPGAGRRSQARSAGAAAASGGNKATASNSALSKSFADWELEG